MNSSNRRETHQVGMTKERMQGLEEMRQAKSGKSRLDQIIEKKKNKQNDMNEGEDDIQEDDNFIVDEEGNAAKYGEDEDEVMEEENKLQGPLTNFVKNMYISGNSKKPKKIGVDSKTVDKNKKTVQNLLNQLNDEDDEDNSGEREKGNQNKYNNITYSNNNNRSYVPSYNKSNSKKNKINENNNSMEIDDLSDSNNNNILENKLNDKNEKISKSAKRKVKETPVKKVNIIDAPSNKRIIKKDVNTTANKSQANFGRNIISTTHTPIKTSSNQNNNFYSNNQSANSNYMLSESALKSSNQNDQLPVENGEINFYWIDAIEEKIQGKPAVIFFGKIFEPKYNCYSSISLVIKNIKRKVYIMPKPEYDDPSKIQEVYNEFNTLRNTKFAFIKEFGCKPKTKNYCFELPIEAKSHTVLKVTYPADYGFIPDNLQGEKFNYIFGKHSSLLENIILSRKIKGPCWLKIKNFEYGNSFNSTWSKFEIIIKDFKNIEICPDKKVIPPLKIMSLSTLVIPNNNINELFAIACTMIDNYHIEDENGLNDINKYEKTVFLRKIDSKLPIMDTRIDATIKSIEYKDVKDIFGPNNLCFALNETALLSLFINKLYKFDPDFIIGHNLYSNHLEVITNRINKLKINNWSKLSKFKREVLPKYLQSSSFSNDYIRNCFAGRLLCDTFLSLREILLRETNYDLRNLCEKYLQERFEEAEVGLVISTFKTIEEIKNLLEICLKEAFFSLVLMDKYMILPLTKQLTTIAGGLWIKSLQGSRASRCEMLLLHEFTEKGYLIPDKYHTALAEEEMLEDDDDNDDEEGGDINKRPKKGRRKPQYAGGLVLDPITGLYDQIILLLDFNSLYPSIIQEYNICFTTVLRKPTQSFVTSNINKNKNEVKTNKKKNAKKKKDKKNNNNDDISENNENNNNDNNNKNDDESADDVTENMEENNEDLEHVEIKGKIKETSEKAILPSILEYLVKGRRSVKALLKKEKDPQKQIILDIRQRALKLTANSLYGYLGYKNSRFYAKEIAALITSTGRKILKNAASIVKIRHGLTVIYGDTDSVMINTMTQNIQEALDLGHKLKKSINEQYKLLEMDIDGLFKSLLLLKKKKYAALKFVEPFTPESKIAKEMKGLDLVRRDWCPVAKETGTRILDCILSGKPKDEIITDILEFMKEVGNAIDEDKFDLKDFAITRQLAKNIDDYGNQKGLPHVNVAKRLKENGDMSIKMMSYIPYIICLPLNGATTKSIADRCYHPKEIENNKNLIIDKLWYKENQIIPIIRRLVIHIKELSLANLCEALGVENKHYYNMNNNDETMNEDDKNVIIANNEFMSAKNGIAIKCLYCNTENKINFFNGRIDGIKKILKCNNCYKCHNTNHIINSILHSIKKNIFLYYRRRKVCFKCKDSTCTLFFRNKCPDINCKGILNRDTSEYDTAQEIHFIETLIVPKGKTDDKIITDFDKETKVIQPFVKKLYEKVKYNQIDLSELMGFLQ